jgi:hypothetical protein
MLIRIEIGLNFYLAFNNKIDAGREVSFFIDKGAFGVFGDFD